MQNIKLIGLLPCEKVIEYLQKAKFLVIPSLQEGFPMTLIEAMAAGTPVIASSIGALKELVKDRFNGLFFTVGDPDDLADKITWLWEHEETRDKMGMNARKEFERKYTPEKNYEILMDIYKRVIESHKKAG